MSLETNIGNAIATFLTGVGLSFTDRLYSQNAKRFSQARLEKKAEHVNALNYLAEKEQSADRAEIILSREYFDNVLKAREYFENTGKQNSIKSRFKQVATKITNYSTSPELINNLSSGSKFALAWGIELVYDGVILGMQTLAGIGHFGRAFAHTLYQSPCFFAGIWLGGQALYLKDLRKSRDEKDLDQIAKELTVDGKLLEIVKNYSPTAKLKVVQSRVVEKEPKELPEGTQAAYSPAEKASNLGERVGTKIADTAEGVGKNVMEGIDTIKQRLEERKAAKEEQERLADEERRKKSEDFLKGY